MLKVGLAILCPLIEKIRQYQLQATAVDPDPTDSADAPADPYTEVMTSGSGNVSYSEEEDVIDKREPDQQASLIMTSGSGNLTYLEIEDAINELEPDQQATLVTLMWLGRGDGEAEEWPDLYQQALERRTDYTADYLLQTPLLADYLEEGLSQLGYSCND